MTDNSNMMDYEPFETAEAEDFPTVTQISVFMCNQIGALLRLTRAFETSDVRIMAMSVVNSIDCAIVRLLFDDPEEASDILKKHGFSISETELLVVSLPHGKRALLQTWLAIMGAEVSIHYTYPLLSQPKGRPAVAIEADNLEIAAQNLSSRNFSVLSQGDLSDCLG